MSSKRRWHGKGLSFVLEMLFWCERALAASGVKPGPIAKIWLATTRQGSLLRAPNGWSSNVGPLNVLEHLGTSPSGTTLTEVSTKLRIGKSTIHRLLATLRDHDFVWLDPRSSRYILGG